MLYLKKENNKKKKQLKKEKVLNCYEHALSLQLDLMKLNIFQ